MSYVFQQKMMKNLQMKTPSRKRRKKDFFSLSSSGLLANAMMSFIGNTSMTGSGGGGGEQSMGECGLNQNTGNTDDSFNNNSLSKGGGN